MVNTGGIFTSAVGLGATIVGGLMLLLWIATAALNPFFALGGLAFIAYVVYTCRYYGKRRKPRATAVTPLPSRTSLDYYEDND